MGLTGIAAGLAQGAALPQQVPALVELDLERPQALVFLVSADLASLQAGTQFALLVDEFVDAGQGVVIRCHGPSVPAVVVGLNAIGA